MTVEEILLSAESKIENLNKIHEEVALYNQEKVLNAFNKNAVALRHFAGTNGYGYDDVGRDTLNRVLSDIFGAEAAIISPYLTCGSHALATALLGLLNRPGQLLFSLTGKPYDTLSEVIFGKEDEDISSLKDFGVLYEGVEFKGNKIDYDEIENRLKNVKPTLLYIQRSRGYSSRDALSINEIEKLIKFARQFSDAPIMVDNCYGEFVDKREPTEVGADLCVGSLIKNIGGGVAPTGGYIVGKQALIDKISYRFSSPSLGLEVGSYAYGYRLFYQGLFLAPHVTCQALKGCQLMSAVFNELGYDVLPKQGELAGDIITSVVLDSEQKMIDVCEIIQSVSPIDSFVKPVPWEMPGYTSKVIMAAGTFVAGASIELSCDGPVLPPYILYLQGGLTYEHVKLAVRKCVEKLINN